jgi:hypothetical protein
VLGGGSIQRADALYEPSGSGAKPQQMYELSGGAFHRRDVKLQVPQPRGKRVVCRCSPKLSLADAASGDRTVLELPDMPDCPTCRACP